MPELFQIRERSPASTGGVALFEMGFRPFFLGAGIHAAVSVWVWLAVYQGWLVVPGEWVPQWWHGHEMIFGFGTAAVAGFLLTAVPNWASTRPLAGRPLAALFGLWLCALLRVFGPLVHGELYRVWVVSSGVLWSSGYALFSWRYAPILWRPRIDR